jgi:hypothetical protein
MERTIVRKESTMSRMLMGVLGAAGLLAAVTGSAPAQTSDTDWVWHTDGKRWWRTEEVVKPFAMPPTMIVEVAPGDEKPGDVRGVKYLGKRTEIVYFREVPRPSSDLAKGHECSWRMHYDGKHTTRESFCVVDGTEQACPGFDKSGRCLIKDKEAPGPSVR